MNLYLVEDVNLNILKYVTAKDWNDADIKSEINNISVISLIQENIK